LLSIRFWRSLEVFEFRQSPKHSAGAEMKQAL
jgi:hypothetical protein